VTAEPVTTEPVTTEPVTTESVTTEPVTTEPVTTEPVTTETVTTEPATAEPVTTEPVTIDTVSARQAAVTEAGEVVLMRDARVRVLSGVTIDMDQARVNNILSEASRILEKKGYGRRDLERDLSAFVVYTEDSGMINRAKTEQAIIDGIGKMGMDPEETLVIFAPRIDGCDIATADFTQRCRDARPGADPAKTIVLPDAYADSVLNPNIRTAIATGRIRNTYPDMSGRMMLARMLVWLRDSYSDDAKKAFLKYIGKITDPSQKAEWAALEGLDNWPDILKKLNELAIRIMPIDYTDIDNFRNSQIATAVSA
jgi:hypothetical protein